MRAIFKFEFFKFIKNPWSISFGVFLPIFYTVLVGSVWGNQLFSGVPSMDIFFPAITIMALITHAFSALPIIFCSDRIEKRIKHLNLAGISPKKYLSAIFLFNYFVFFIIYVVCFVVALSAFHLTPSWRMILIPLLMNILYFLIHFLLSSIVGSTVNSIRTAMFVTFLILYVLLFTSGSTIPAYILPDWFKYLQFVTPTGSAVLVSTYLCNGFDVTKIWEAFISLTVYIILFSFLAMYLFKWE